jgi:XTP/dITP diphosphohydrolase
MKLLVATRNEGKIKELAVLLQELPYKLMSLNDLNIEHEVDETGKTFEQNAILKAEEYGSLASMMTISDDSGIEVDALGGEPGVLSARYGGEGLNDNDRNNLLLSNVSDVKPSFLTARFRCVVAVFHPNKETVTFDGKVEGYITRKPRGENGFGYDPLFFFPPKGRTLAEIPSNEKHEISHRGYAARKASKYLIAQKNSM